VREIPGNGYQACTRTGGGVLVITEGVFGMAGDLGKLDEIAALKKKYNFRLLVDDAHGIGHMGKTGAGCGEHFGVQDDIDLYFSTFAKAMAGIGAFVAGDEEVILICSIICALRLLQITTHANGSWFSEAFGSFNE
jgi:7-keto-8-aminopelargonate synthetase-like enzyme